MRFLVHHIALNPSMVLFSKDRSEEIDRAINFSDLLVTTIMTKTNANKFQYYYLSSQPNIKSLFVKLVSCSSLFVVFLITAHFIPCLVLYYFPRSINFFRVAPLSSCQFVLRILIFHFISFCFRKSFYVSVVLRLNI